MNQLYEKKFLKFMQKFGIVAIENCELELISFLIQAEWKYNFNGSGNCSV